MHINEHYLKLKAGYLFPEISRRVGIFSQANPDAKIIRLGIGDVTLPLAPAVVAAGQKAFAEMGEMATFRGYGPEQGYDFLREAIAVNDFKSRGCDISADEIFISDGSKCDVGNFQELFSQNAVIAVPDPVYPVYVDTNVMAGRTGNVDATGCYAGLVYLSSSEQSGFLPELPKQKVDAIYLCFPNNPTGAVADSKTLQKWVDYALAHEALLLFDAAYESYIHDTTLPHSIYEIPGAKKCAVEFRSFSKTAGFTGTRCAFTVVPKDLLIKTNSGEVSLHNLWNRRQSTKFNGVSYPIQKAAAACYSTEGKAQISASIAYYMENARLIYQGLKTMGFTVYGGENAPYIWLKTPADLSSWDFFDALLNRAHIVGTPGSGFGSCGEGYFRLSAFGSRENVVQAIERMRTRFKTV